MARTDGWTLKLAGVPDWLQGATERALRAEAPLDLSRPRHPQITRLLRRIAFGPDRDLPPTLPRSPEGWPGLPIVFSSDGSEATPFPISCLPEPGPAKPPTPARALRASMITFRHQELDPLTPLALMRNSETSRLTAAAQEELSFRRTLEILLDATWDTLEDPCRAMEIYHTGLEPVVVGVYRAVATALRRRHDRGRPSLVVWPMIYTRPRAELPARPQDLAPGSLRKKIGFDERPERSKHFILWLAGAMTEDDRGALRAWLATQTAHADDIAATLFAQSRSGTAYERLDPWWVAPA